MKFCIKHKISETIKISKRAMWPNIAIYVVLSCHEFCSIIVLYIIAPEEISVTADNTQQKNNT